MKIFAVTVTYSNRFDLVKQAIDSAFSEGVIKVIVVDNFSHIESREKLREYEKFSFDKVKVIYLPENMGSSGGFKIGLKEAYDDNECEFVWLLDDDNVAHRSALETLKIFWSEKELEPDNTMLISLRTDRKVYYESIEKNNTEILTGKINSFMGFCFFSYIKNIFFNNKDESYIIDRNYGVTHQAPYGGMFFHKSLIDKIGYPNEKFFVYADDTEYSYRLIKNGGNIYAVLNSLLKDVDISWHNIDYNKGFISSPILDTPSDFKVYYTFRNRVYFELNNRVFNRFIYFLNMFVFLVRLFISAFFKFKFIRFGLIMVAIKDGLNGSLGKRDFN